MFIKNNISSNNHQHHLNHKLYHLKFLSFFIQQNQKLLSSYKPYFFFQLFYLPYLLFLNYNFLQVGLTIPSSPSTFSAEKLQNVQDKIAELRASLEQSIIDDQEEEVQAQLNFEAQIVEIDEQRANLQSEKAENQDKLKSNQLPLKKRKYDAGRELDQATKGKVAKEAECEAWKTQYARDTEQRITEIGIIRQIEQILATKLEGASSYIKGRNN